MTGRLLAPSLALLLCAAPAALAQTPETVAGDTPVAPKVLVITMFAGEAAPWRENNTFTRTIPVPGLSKEFPNVECTAEDLCHMTTTMGFANAASSVAAVALSPVLDLSQTYVLIAGIAGVDPNDGTLGSAHWARYAVDGGLRHEIDPRQMPEGWSSGYLALGATEPGVKGEWSAGSEVYRLNEDLLLAAFELSRDTELSDSEDAAAYRAAYVEEAGKATPTVTICDTLSSDTYWHGTRIAEAMEAHVTLMTDGEGDYCTTQMEDNATLTALRRAADAGRLDFERVALLRTSSNFDREAAGQTAAQSLGAKSGGFPLATENAYRVGSRLTDAIVGNWDEWKDGAPVSTP